MKEGLLKKMLLLFRQSIAESAGVALGALIIMVIFEELKHLAHADITIVESHVITSIFVSLMAGVGAYFIIRRTKRKTAKSEEERQRNQETIKLFAKEVEVIAEIGRIISSTLDIDEVYEKFAVEVKKLISFDRLAVNLHSLHEENVKVVHTFGEKVPGRCNEDLFPLEGSACENITKTRMGEYSNAQNTEEMKKINSQFARAGFYSLLCVPLIYRNEVVGSLHFRSKTPNAYTERSLRLAEKIGTQIAGAIGNAQLFFELKRAEESLQESEKEYRELSIVDDLTQLYNSRHFYHQLKIELERSNRYKQPITLLLLDLDNFKAFNDAYGHVEGDEVLRRLGQVVKRCLRETDFAYRYGGEEFTILLPMAISADGAITAERIRTELKKESFFPMPDQEVHMTMSIGLAQYKPGEDMKVFVHRVDQLMYQGKKNGKDCVYFENRSE
jgi:diguanylate cyclase (GGDEF)-like protein